MNKIWCIARTEYLNSVRSRAFLMGLILLPIFMGGGILVQHFARSKVDVSPRKFMVVDRTGQLFPVLAAKARDYNENAVFEWTDGQKGKQVHSRFIPEEFPGSTNDEKSTEIKLSQKIRAKELFAFLVVEAEGGNTDAGAFQAAYFSDTPGYFELPSWIERVLSAEAQRRRVAAAKLDEVLVRRLTAPVHVRSLGLASVGAKGEIVKAKETNQIATFAVPAGSMILLFMLVMTSAPTLLNSILEEKMNKIAEVLVSSVTPFQLMMGKLGGAVLTSMTLSAIYLSAIGVLSWRYHFAEFIPASLYFWLLFFQLLAFLIYGSIFLALGSACNELRDAQSLMSPAMLIVMIPMFVWMPVLQSPSSGFARTLSLIPTATPMLMLLRIATRPGPPWWEIALGVVLTTAFMFLCLWAGARIFRIGVLSQGQPPSFRRLLTWAFSK
jgi:ABC-2 type transport system permease protein